MISETFSVYKVDVALPKDITIITKELKPNIVDTIVGVFFYRLASGPPSGYVVGHHNSWYESLQLPLHVISSKTAV